MKIAILGDAHFLVRNGSKSFNEYFEKFYTNIFFPYLINNNIKTVIQVGDLWDNRRTTHIQGLSECKRYFFSKFDEYGINLITIIGNHDSAYKDTIKVNSPKLLLNEYKNIRVIDEPITESLFGYDICFLPWICKDNYDQTMEEIKTTRAEICFGHLELKGFPMYKGILCEEGMDASLFNKFENVLTGHYHHRSNSGNIQYTGCIHRTGKVLTEDGHKTIKNIVDTKYSGKVMSINKSGVFEWNKIINYKSENNTGKLWVSLNSYNNKKPQVICTEDHPILVVDDVLFPKKFDYIEAKDLTNKFVVRCVNNKYYHNNRRSSNLFNSDQISVLIGSLMGDGHITKNYVYYEEHSIHQKDYLLFKSNLLNKHITFRDRKFLSCSLTFRSTAQLTALRELFYIDGVKCVKNVLNYLNPISLAMWYIDDGNLKYQTKNGKKYLSGFSLNTQGFSYEENVLIKNWFNTNYGIALTITQAKRHNNYYLNCYNKSGYDKFFKLISEYVPNCMYSYVYNGRLVHKLPEKYIPKKQYSYDKKLLSYSAQKITKVHYLPKVGFESKLYDIEVENNHNFVVNDTVVHNCPYELTWHDDSDPKGFHILDLSTRELEFIKNPYKMFNKIYYDDVLNEDDIKEDIENSMLYQYSDSYIKVVVKNKENPYLFDLFIDALYKVTPIDLTIIEEVAEVLEEELHDVDETEDTLSILNKYVDNVKIKDLNSSKIKGILSSLYQEAISLETI